MEEKQLMKKPKHHNDQNDVDYPTNRFNQLPYEIAVDILSRLPIASLIRTSFVCRSLYSLSHDPNLADMHVSRSSSNDSLCLIVHCDYPIQNQLHFLHLSSDQTIRKIDIPFATSMPKFNIIGSSKGLLCLINTLFPESMYLFNPFTRNFLELPKNFDSSQDQVVVYGFGSHPTTNDYKVIKLTQYTNSFHHTKSSSEVQIYSLNKNKWENKGMVPYRLEKWSSPGVVVNGRLHWVTQWSKYNNGCPDRFIVSFDLSDDSFHVIENPKCRFFGSLRWWGSFQLAAVKDGCLCAVMPVPAESRALDIWVMKEYGVRESWVKEFSIGVYYPVSMIGPPELERSHYRSWRKKFGNKSVRVLCVLRSGEVVLEYRGGGLVSYDLHEKRFKDLVYEGMPRIYMATVHVGSLKSLAFR